MKSLHSVLFPLICILLTSCGQKYPKAYGVYMKQGGAWVSIKPSNEAIEINSHPEFLVTDSRLVNNSTRPSSEITLSPVKWVRWSIKSLVAKRDAEPSSYAKVKADQFVQVEAPFDLAYLPIKKREDAILVTVPKPLPDGYYWLTIFDDTVLCRLNAASKPNELQDIHIVDRWDIVFDESSGFSWDAFLTATGVSQRDTQYHHPKKLDALVNSLRHEIERCTNSSDINQCIALCQKVRHLDDNLYLEAQSRCTSLAEALMEAAALRGDYPTAIGIGMLVTNAVSSSARISDAITKYTIALSEVEKSSMLLVDRLDKDNRGTGKTIATYPTRQTTITDTHVEYNRRNPTRNWFGNMQGTPRARQIFSYKVEVDYWPGHGTGEVDEESFDTEAEGQAYLRVLSEALTSWRAKWRDDLARHVIARPQFWSERIYYAYPCDVMVGDFEEPLHMYDFERQRLVDVETGTTDDYKWLRVKSKSTNAVNIVVRLCSGVFVDEDKERIRRLVELESKEMGIKAAPLLPGTWKWGDSGDIIIISPDGNYDWSPFRGMPGKGTWALDWNIITFAESDGSQKYYRIVEAESSHVRFREIQESQLDESERARYRTVRGDGTVVHLFRKSLQPSVD